MITFGRCLVQWRSPKAKANQDSDSGLVDLREQQQISLNRNSTPQLPMNIDAPVSAMVPAVIPRERLATTPVIQLPPQTLQPA